MEIIDAYGDNILMLSDSAKCRCTGENPDYMDECPTGEFEGNCCPEMCRHYEED